MTLTPLIDLAAESGGNCALTRPGERVDHDGRIVLGPLNLAAGAPLHASQMYARNLFNFTALLLDENGNLAADFEDELVARSCVTRDGQILEMN